YNPKTGVWTTKASMHQPRHLATATLLPDGRVLVVGGFVCLNQQGCTTNTAEVYDPASNSWSFVTPMNTDRAWHDAALLDDGRVLFAGGRNDAGDAGASAEIYDPATDGWSAASKMPHSRYAFKFAILPNGNVLAICGNWSQGVNAVDLYVPASNSWRRA